MRVVDVGLVRYCLSIVEACQLDFRRVSCGLVHRCLSIVDVIDLYFMRSWSVEYALYMQWYWHQVDEHKTEDGSIDREDHIQWEPREVDTDTNGHHQKNVGDVLFLQLFCFGVVEETEKPGSILLFGYFEISKYSGITE